MKYQEIYINLDDSGKLSKKEKICVYGGIVFLKKEEKDKFITQYRSIINDIKCHYCNNKCLNNCPEIKNTNIKPKDKRRIMNYIKKYFTIGIIINNNKVYDYIMENKASKGRYIDFSIRRLTKELIKILINENKINPNNPIKLIINIDQQTTKDNGYYNLHDGIYEELVHGINNFDYQKTFSPILKNKLEVIINYQNSNKSYVIQASDLLAGTIRNKYLKQENLPINLKIFLP